MIDDDNTLASAEWIPYRAKLAEMQEMLRVLYDERNMYRHRCLELVKQHDLQRDEIENLRRRLREKTAKLRKETT